MENNSSGMSNLVERFGKRDKSHRDKDHKDHRLSKADIGGPISSSAEKTDGTDPQFGTPVLVLRCVIVHKDENGYGLTVSGDNPVYVQSVKEDGAAYKAGVRQGDRIVNVNGTRVTEYNHLEVVKLIKSGAFVNLTLLGKPLTKESSGSSAPATAINMPTVGQPAASNEETFFNEKVATIKKMLKQEAAEVERIKEEYAKQPNSRLLNQLRVAQKLKQDLEKQLWKAESIHQNQLDMVQVPAGSHDITTTDTTNTGDLDGITVYDSEEIPEHSERNNQSEARLNDEQSNTMHGSDDRTNAMQSTTIVVDDFSQPQNPNIINFEDDDIAGGAEAYHDHGPFSDFERLRTKHAHMAIFINYVFSHHDPNPLLLILSVDSFKALTSTKEMGKAADNICKVYINPNAPLRVKIDEGVAKSIADTIHGKNLSEDSLRTVFSPAVQYCLPSVQSQLSMFCTKREQGLSTMFGEDKLQAIKPSMDNSQETRIVEEVIQSLLGDLAGAPDKDNIDVAKADALQAYLIHVTGKRKSRTISKMASILRPNRPHQGMSKRVSGSVESIIEDQKRSSVLFGGQKNKRKGKPKEGAISGSERVRSFIERRDSRRVKERSTTLNDHSSNGGHIPRHRHSAHGPSKLTDGSPNANRRHFSAVENRNNNIYPLQKNLSYGKLQTPELATIVASPFIVRRKKAAHHTTAAHLVSSVIPGIQPSHPVMVNPDSTGQVSQMINKFQDGSSDNSDQHKKGHRRTGSFHKNEIKRTRPANGKSSSDPDVNSIENAISQSSSMDTVDQNHSQISSSSSFAGSTSLASQDDLANLPYDPSDPELEIEADTNWSATAPPKVIKGLEKKEVKRQEVIFELLHTEKHHVRDLKILYLLFYERMSTENLLNQTELNLVFPNLSVILEMHRQLNTKFQKLKESSGHVIQYIGDILLSRFDDVEGKKFKEECALYCGNQSMALDFIKEKCKKDQKFNTFIQNTERYQICRRLQLKDFVPMEFQRLTKYPLLLENIIKNTRKKDVEEVQKLKKVLQQCKEILSYVNKAVKDAEDHQKIVEIQNNLDASPLQKVNHPILEEYNNINLLDRALVHQGPLVWKINQTDKKKLVDLHCVVFEDVIVLLQRQDEKYVLKCHNNTAANSSIRGEDKEKQLIHPPILKLSKVLVRNVATDKKAFFIVSMSEFGPQMYELAAKTTAMMQEWLKIISEAGEVARKKEMQHKRRDGFSITETARPIESKTRRRQISLEQPSPVHHALETADTPQEAAVGTLEEMLQPQQQQEIGIMERIQHKHEEIVAAVAFKHKLLAEAAGLPDEDLDNMIDMALSDADPEPTTLVIHSLLHADKLTNIINDLMQPDTVFIQSPQTLLVPTDNTRERGTISSSSSNTTTPVHQTEDGKDAPQSDPTEEEHSFKAPEDVSLQQIEISVRDNETTDQETENSPESQEESLNQTEVTKDETVTQGTELDQDESSTQNEEDNNKEEVLPENVPLPLSDEDEPESVAEDEVKEDYSSSVDPPQNPVDSPDRSSNTSLDLVMSDYETASDATSAPIQSEENNSYNDNQDISVSLASTLQTDTGISTEHSDDDDAASDNTLSAIEPQLSEATNSTNLVGDLLSFEPAIAPPDGEQVENILSPVTEHLMVKTDPVRLGKMLEITRNLQAQLTQLLRAVKLSEADRQRLVEENQNLKANLLHIQQQQASTSENTNEEVLESTPDGTTEENNNETEPEEVLPSYASVVSGRCEINAN